MERLQIWRGLKKANHTSFVHDVDSLVDACIDEAFEGDYAVGCVASPGRHPPFCVDNWILEKEYR